MLIACHQCQRQYDVRDHDPGTELRCACGATLVVPERRAPDAVMHHCAACGAGLPAHATECNHCGTAVSAASRGISHTCSQCMTRLPKHAKFCPGCGAGVQVESVRRAPSTRCCPRCDGQLTEVDGNDAQGRGFSFSECDQCGGLWLDEKTVEDLVRKTAEDRVPLPHGKATGFQRSLSDRERPEVVHRSFYIRCPICEEPMHRKNFGRVSGVILDWCKDHGYWFDADELEAVLAFVDRGGFDTTKRLEAEDAAERRRQLSPKPNPAIRRARERSTRRLNEQRPGGFLADLLVTLGDLLR